MVGQLSRPSYKEDRMNSACPRVKWISVPLLLISLCASVPFSRLTIAQAIKDEASSSQRNCRGRASADCPIPYFPVLRRYATDLTLLALRGKREQAADYEPDIARVLASLATSTKAPVVLGEFELDREAITRGVAFRVACGDVPDTLRDKYVFSLSLDALAKGAHTREEFENRVQAVFAEADKAQG